MNYYISDMHLFHKNVTKAGKDFDDRPFEDLEEMHALFKEKWNAIRKCLCGMNNSEFFDRRAGDKLLRAYNVGCMMPYMDYEPRTLTEIVEGSKACP